MRRGERRTVGGLTVVSLAGVPPVTRVGLVAGKRLGSAVVRNRIKRRIRHACRDVGLARGWDHVVIPSPVVADVAYSTLVDWLERAVERHD
jgi:ribonuclease P protein component